MTTEEAKAKWEVNKALIRMRHLVEADYHVNKFESYEYWHSIKAYIGLLEMELESYKRKEKDGLRIQSK